MYRPGPVLSYKLRYIVCFGLVGMPILTNPKHTIYREYVPYSLDDIDIDLRCLIGVHCDLDQSYARNPGQRNAPCLHLDFVALFLREHDQWRCEVITPEPSHPRPRYPPSLDQDAALSCKVKRQEQLTFQVSSYCLLALQSHACLPGGDDQWPWMNTSPDRIKCHKWSPMRPRSIPFLTWWQNRIGHQ